MSLLEDLLKSCRPEDVVTTNCCPCKEDDKALTSAWRDSLESGGGSYASMNLIPAGQQGASASKPSNRRGANALEVAAEFDRAWGIGGQASQVTEEEQRRCLQASVQAFTRSLLRGISMSVLLEDGRTLLAEASLDTDLTHLVLHVPNLQHPVALRCIESVGAPYDVTQADGMTSSQAYLEERCTTLVIKGGQYLTFVFASPSTREYFEVCLKVLIVAREGAVPSRSRVSERVAPPATPFAHEPLPADIRGDVDGVLADARP